MELEELAAQLRKPDGRNGKEVGVFMSRGNKEINDWSIAALQPGPGDTVLEIGMGNGAFVPSILSRHATVIYHGCDHSELMVVEAARINRDFVREGRASFVTGDVAHLPYADDSFSKVMTVNTLYFWGSAEAEFGEIRRVLKEAGTLVIGVRTEKTMEQMPFTSFGFEKYSEQRLLNLVSANGFDILDSYCRQEAPYEFKGSTISLGNIIVTCRSTK